MIKERLLESVINMYGGTEHLIEEILYIVENDESIKSKAKEWIKDDLKYRYGKMTDDEHFYKHYPFDYDNHEIRKYLQTHGYRTDSSESKLQKGIKKTYKRQLDNARRKSDYWDAGDDYDYESSHYPYVDRSSSEHSINQK